MIEEIIKLKCILEFEKGVWTVVRQDYLAEKYEGGFIDKNYVGTKFKEI